jgi:hypothetical protein
MIVRKESLWKERHRQRIKGGNSLSCGAKGHHWQIMIMIRFFSVRNLMPKTDQKRSEPDSRMSPYNLLATWFTTIANITLCRGRIIEGSN